MQKKFINYISIILMLVSFIFIIRRIMLLNVDFSELITPINVAMIVIMPFLSIVVIFSNSYCWRMVLSLFTNNDIFVGETFSAYAKANMMKYLPGNIGHYAGRQLFGVKLGIKQIQLAIASILEIMYSAFAMLICAFVFSANMILQLIETQFTIRLFIKLSIIVIITIGVIILVGYLLRKHRYVIVLTEIMKSFKFWRVFVTSVLLFAFGSTILVLEYVVLVGQYVTLNFHSMFILLAANFFATFIGFITPGVPGGIGVRETVLLSALSSVFSGDVVILAAIIHRVIMIVGDVITAFMSNLFIVKNNIENKNKFENINSVEAD